MAHTSTKLNDFTHPIKANGSLNVGVKKSLLASLRAMFGKTVLPALGAFTFSATTVASVPGLSFRVKKNKTYRIDAKLLTTSDGTSGIKLGLALSGSSAAAGNINFAYCTAAGAKVVQNVASNVLSTNSTGVAAVEKEVFIYGYFIPDVSGYVTVSAGTFTGSTSGTIDVGSFATVARIQG